MIPYVVQESYTRPYLSVPYTCSHMLFNAGDLHDTICSTADLHKATFISTVDLHPYVVQCRSLTRDLNVAQHETDSRPYVVLYREHVRPYV